MIWNHELIWNREMIWNHELIWNREIIWNCEMIFIFLKIREFFISSSFFFRKYIDFVFEFFIWNRFNSFLSKIYFRSRKKKTLLFFVMRLSLSIFEKKLTLFFFVEKMRSIVFSIDLNLQTRDKSLFMLKILQLLKNFAIVDELSDTSFSNFNNESINWVVLKIVFVVNDRDFVDFWN